MSRLVTTALAALFLLAVPAFSADPADPLIAQGRAAMAAGNSDKAIDFLKQAVERAPKNAEAHRYLAEAYGDAAQTANIFSQASLAGKCRDEFERAVELDANLIDAREGLLQYYLMAPGILGGSVEKANQQAQEIRKRDSLRGHLAMARIHNYEKKPDLTRAEYAAMVREQPSSPKAHFYYGTYLINQKEYDAAAPEIEASIKLDPNYMMGWFQIGKLAALTGKDAARGEDALKRYINYKPGEDEPGVHRAHYWLGALYERLGRKAEAKAEYAASLKLNAKQKDAQEAMKRVS
jgi:predicted Zn-dependent protease